MDSLSHNTGLSRKDREKMARENEIIRSARLLFARKGYHDTTLEEIAHHAELGKGTIYNYFVSKDELFYGIVRQLLDDVQGLVNAALNLPGGDAREKLTIYAKSILKYVGENADLLHLLMQVFWQDSTRQLGKKKEIEDHVEKVRNILAKAIQPDINRGRIKKYEAFELALLFDSALWQLAMHKSEQGRKLGMKQLDHAANLLVTMFFDGIALRTRKD